MGKRRLIVGAVCAVMLGATVAAGSATGATKASSAAAKSPFTVLAVIDVTGPGKVYGVQMNLGLQAAANYLNKRGGIYGHPVKIVVKTDNFDAGQATSALLQYLSSNPSPQLVVAGLADAETGALFPILAKKGILSIAGEDGNQLVGHAANKRFPTEFSTQASTVPVVQAAAKWFKSHGLKNIGVLQSEQNYMIAESANMQTAFAKAGLKPTVVTFPPTALDLSSEVSQLQSDKVQAMFFEGISPVFGYALKAREQLGWNVPVLGDIASSTLDLTQLATPQQLAGVSILNFRSNVFGIKDHGLKTLEKYVKPLSKIGTIGTVPVDEAGLGWDGLLAVSHAATAVKSIKAAAIAKGLTHMSKADQADPNYVNYAKIVYTPSDHEVAGSPTDYPVSAPGAVLNGQVHPGH